MGDLPVETTGARRAAPETSELPGARRVRRPLVATLAFLLAVPVLAAVYESRPAPYGDHFTAGARYTRDGRHPLAVLRARGDAITLWDDGLVTAADGSAVRWHRALPASADWLPAQGGTGVLRPLGRGLLAVVTPPRIAAYRIADGDLRWVVPARGGCAFAPERAVRHAAGALLVAQLCPESAWTSQLIAVDELGRTTLHRAPLGDSLAGGRPEHPNTEKVVAQPR
ncbi:MULTISPECIES: hypothetical protein [unclassified Streptomyces]|uniref:hypothetical protein n=1 Tax=unclassified Streptomyces TaxID=2593676 RepID=UPI0022586FB0|nr:MULTISPECIES: hypothetical protein [unclassified Streptomyces]MCX4879874.1 hypothetical protein [Streptomyces sp. NBC_00847]MCX5419856.1 hypothetical protein [Streptomyces sp. NBC_00078]